MQLEHSSVLIMSRAVNVSNTTCYHSPQSSGEVPVSVMSHDHTADSKEGRRQDPHVVTTKLLSLHSLRRQ
jgi:hypothetical protein